MNCHFENWNTSYSYMLSATKGHAIIIASIWEEDSGNVIFLIRPQALWSEDSLCCTAETVKQLLTTYNIV